MTADYRIVRDYISKRNDGVRDFGDDEDLIESGLIDSLQFVEFIMFIEEASGSPIDMDTLDIEQFRTLTCIRKAFFAESLADTNSKR